MLRRYVYALFAALSLLASGCSEQATVLERGEASYYAKSLQGNKTANGEIYQHGALTAAHRTLEFGTRVRVTYPKTGKSVVVVVNDRGPYAEDRIIDLSGEAAKQIGLIDDGHGMVQLELLD